MLCQRIFLAWPGPASPCFLPSCPAEQDLPGFAMDLPLFALGLPCLASCLTLQWTCFSLPWTLICLLLLSALPPWGSPWIQPHLQPLSLHLRPSPAPPTAPSTTPYPDPASCYALRLCLHFLQPHHKHPCILILLTPNPSLASSPAQSVTLARTSCMSMTTDKER